MSTEAIDRTKIFPAEFARGQWWAKVFKDAHLKVVASNDDDFKKAYTVVLQNEHGWTVFAHRNIFGDVNHVTVWPPNSARLFEVHNVQQLDDVIKRVEKA